MDAQNAIPLGIARKPIIIKKGKILLLQGFVNYEFEAGIWKFSDGTINFCRKLIETLKREVRKEIGLPVKEGSTLITKNFFKKAFRVSSVTLGC